jgi:hypothetical protein
VEVKIYVGQCARTNIIGIERMPVTTLLDYFEYQNLNLANCKIPDGYQAKGWSEENDLLVEKWKPYYYRQKLGELKTGSLYKGVRVKLIESAQNKIEAKQISDRDRGMLRGSNLCRFSSPLVAFIPLLLLAPAWHVGQTSNEEAKAALADIALLK